MMALESFSSFPFLPVAKRRIKSGTNRKAETVRRLGRQARV
jgi:hypothetical protein